MRASVRMQRCPGCGGQGGHYRPVKRFGVIGMAWEDCPVCDGSGVIWVRLGDRAQGR